MSQEKELVSFLNEIGVSEKFRIEENLGFGFVRLNIEESQRRQAKHDIRSIEDAVVELLRNSRDAKAKNILVSTRKRNGTREVWVIDDGQGIPPSLTEKIFEPRVTSKVEKIIEDDYGIHGRGMALYAVKIRCVEARVIKSQPNQSTVIKICSDCKELPERSDQSTMPLFKKVRGKIELSGPLNIPRAVADFALKNPSVNFYFGLPSQTAGTLVKLAMFSSLFDDFSVKDVESLRGVFNRFFGFTISKRNAYRCLSMQLKAIKINDIMRLGNVKKLRQRSLASIIDNSELEILLEKTLQDLDKIAEKYNLKVVEKNIAKKGKVIKLVLALDIREDI